MTDQPIDTPNNTEIVYVYINNFMWTLDIDKETSVGHPFPHRLYRAVFNRDTKTYRIIFNMEGKFRAVFVGDLQNRDEVKGYVSDIKLVTLNNILDFKISEADLNDFNNWLIIKNQDLLSQMWPDKKSVQPQPGQELIKITSATQLANVFAEFMKNGDPLFSDLMENMHKLREANPPLVDAMAVFVAFMLDEVPVDSPIDPYWLHLDKDHGAGANITSAVQKLSRYTSGNRRTNLMEEDLLGAIKDLLLEQQRRNIHEI